MTSIPPFNEQVVDDGYRWWYVDAISDDGEFAITLILFVGSVFSPYYASARRSGKGFAENYCALNVALYGPLKRWAMTERGAQSVSRSAHEFRLHKSVVTQTQTELSFDIDEWTVPIPRRLRGRVTVKIPSTGTDAVALDTEKTHHWQPIAPHTPIEVAMNSPNLSWQGTAYVDSNVGTRSLESTFRQWQWSRAHLPNGETIVQYDTEELTGSSNNHTWRLTDSNRTLVNSLDRPTNLPTTQIWRIGRSTRTDENNRIEQLNTLEDTPFYARSRYRTVIDNHSANCMHESLDLQRFSARWTQCLLPFRMPRRTGAIDLNGTPKHA